MNNYKVSFNVENSMSEDELESHIINSLLHDSTLGNLKIELDTPEWRKIRSWVAVFVHKQLSCKITHHTKLSDLYRPDQIHRVVTEILDQFEIQSLEIDKIETLNDIHDLVTQ